MSESSKYVYLYLQVRGNREVPVYVGRGTASRVTSHSVDDPNAALASILSQGKYSVEIMDCGNEERAILVEGALISALRGRTSVDLKNRRLDKHSFVPLGVPISLSYRGAEKPLRPVEVAQMAGGPVILVRIGAGNLSSDGRGIIDYGNPDDAAVADRVARWWYLSEWIERWSDRDELKPVALIGVAGSKNKFILAALDLREVNWSSLTRNGRQVAFSSDEGDIPELDAFSLRGRKLVEVPPFTQSGRGLVKIFESSGEVLFENRLLRLRV